MGRYLSKKQSIQEANLALNKRILIENSGWAKATTFSPMDEQNQPAHTKEELRSMGMEIQKGLDELTQRLKNKIVKINERDYYILDLSLREITTLSKKDPSIVGEIEVNYSENQEGSKLRQQYLVAHFKNTDTPMVVNEFTSLFPDSFAGARPYRSTELQNYLNSVVTKVLGKK